MTIQNQSCKPPFPYIIYLVGLGTNVIGFLDLLNGVFGSREIDIHSGYVTALLGQFQGYGST